MGLVTRSGSGGPNHLQRILELAPVVDAMQRLGTFGRGNQLTNLSLRFETALHMLGHRLGDGA